MSSFVSTILELANPYHAYVFGTSFWYFLRGIMRVISPETVCGWFRPPVMGTPTPNGSYLAFPTLEHIIDIPEDLELYTVWTDGFQLLTLSMILLVLGDAVPLPKSLAGSALADSAPTSAKKPYARAAVLITMFHHITTGIGAYQHWALPTHHTVAMDIGVYGNIFLTLLGVGALAYGLPDSGAVALSGKKKA